MELVVDNPQAAASASALPTERYFNREMSWLAFNFRVLEEAANHHHPLLERLRFLSISGDNLDEFFMVRVAGLKGQQLQGVEERSADGMTPAQQLTAIAEAADRLMARQQEIWGQLKHELAKADFRILDSEELTNTQAEWLQAHFNDQIFPVLTPQAIAPAHPFPFVPHNGFGLFFYLKRTGHGAVILQMLMIPCSPPSEQ